MGTNKARCKYWKHVSPTRQVNICLAARIDTTIKIPFLLYGMAPETARGSSSEVKAKSVGQTSVLQRRIRRSRKPYQPQSQLRKESLQRGHDTSTAGIVARAIAFSKLWNVIMTCDSATASVIDAMLERGLQLIQT